MVWSYLILQATMDVQLYQPSLTVRYSMAKNPNKFLRKVVDLIGKGTGFPAFHNDDLGIMMVMNKGVPLKEAYDWNPCGCVETNLEGRMRPYTALADINLGSVIELTLNRGVCRKTGKKISVDAGDPSTFATYADFEAAVKRTFAYIDRVVVMGSHVLDDIGRDWVSPALSLTFKECIEKAVDYSAGGANKRLRQRHHPDRRGRPHQAWRRSATWSTRRRSSPWSACARPWPPNFEGDQPSAGCASMRRNTAMTTRSATSPGRCSPSWPTTSRSYSSKFGKMTPGILPVSGNTPFGLEVGALPSGRMAWKPLADGVSPSGGTDIKGPTAVIKSVASLPHGRFVQGTLLNMKVEPDLFSSEFGVSQMMALLKSLCSLGVYHVQFNVIDQEKLIAAQRHPEDYKGLLVRVAGYTAYFVELGKDVQDEIIARTVQHQQAAVC